MKTLHLAFPFQTLTTPTAPVSSSVLGQAPALTCCAGWIRQRAISFGGGARPEAFRTRAPRWTAVSFASPMSNRTMRADTTAAMGSPGNMSHSTWTDMKVIHSTKEAEDMCWKISL